MSEPIELYVYWSNPVEALSVVTLVMVSCFVVLVGLHFLSNFIVGRAGKREATGAREDVESGTIPPVKAIEAESSLWKQTRAWLSDADVPCCVRFIRFLMLADVTVLAGSFFVMCAGIILLVAQAQLPINSFLWWSSVMWAVILFIAFVQVCMRNRGAGWRKRGWQWWRAVVKSSSCRLAACNFVSILLICISNTMLSTFSSSIGGMEKPLAMLIEQVVVLVPTAAAYGWYLYDQWHKTDQHADTRWFDRVTIYLFVLAMASVLIPIGEVSGMPKYFLTMVGAFFSFGVVAFIKHLWDERICPAKPANAFE